ncbi:hypothetical protein LADH09A_000914 [Micromonospora sp. LAH09]|uniref:hypothetical protein n=1 Tax=Micromonospora cabrerizensis TaxID=2911213 RepID=UPI001EE907E2|nr:hypothetical protein [Micromonospora cabrerizensis]MCG5473030.1 hypothetical protein [Micromonospora cabrerizensis]
MIGILLIELRRSPMRWLFVPLVVLGTVLLFGLDREWIGVWPQTSAYAQRPVMFLSAAAAAAAAWSSGRAARQGMADRISASARRPEIVEAMRIAATGAYAIAAYAAVVVAAVVTTALATDDIAIWPSYLLLGATTIITATAIGDLAGRHLHTKIAAPIAGAGVLVVVFATTSQPVFSFVVLSGRPQVELTPRALAARTFLSVVAVVAAVVWSPRTPLSRQFRLPAVQRVGAALVAVVVGGLAVTGVAAAGEVSRPRDAPAEPRCAGTNIRVCVWPENRKYLPHALDLAERITAATAMTPKPVTSITFVEEGLRRSPTGQDDGFPLGITDFSTAYMMTLQMLPPFGTCESYDSPQTQSWTEAWIRVMDWILVGSAGPIVAQRLPAGRLAAATDLRSLAEDQQRAAVAGLYRILEGPYCDA